MTKKNNNTENPLSQKSVADGRGTAGKSQGTDETQSRAIRKNRTPVATIPVDTPQATEPVAAAGQKGETAKAQESTGGSKSSAPRTRDVSANPLLKKPTAKGSRPGSNAASQTGKAQIPQPPAAKAQATPSPSTTGKTAPPEVVAAKTARQPVATEMTAVVAAKPAAVAAAKPTATSESPGNSTTAATEAPSEKTPAASERTAQDSNSFRSNEVPSGSETQSVNEQPAASPAKFSGPALKKQIEEIASREKMRARFYPDVFTAVAESLNAVWGMLELSDGARNLTRQYQKTEMNTSVLIDMALQLSEEARMDNVSRAKMIPVGEATFSATSCPLLDADSGEVIGSMTLFIPVIDRDEAAKFLKTLERAVGFLTRTFYAVQDKPSTPTVAPELQALLNASKYDTLKGLSFALANTFCQKLGCQKTAIGIVKPDNQIELYSVSGMDSIVANSPAIVDIRQSQEECFDAGHQIVVQTSDGISDAESNGMLIHRRWHKQTGASAVASIPVKVDDRVIAVFSLERHLSKPYSKAELEQVSSTIQTFGPAIEILKKSDRSLSHHVKDSFRNLKTKLLGNRKVAIGLAVATIFVLFGWLPYRPVVPCTIQPAKVSHLLAPYDGVIASAPLVPGDVVEEGQTLVSLDVRSLELERDSLSASIRSLEIERNSALAEGDRTSAAVIDAEIAALLVQLRIAERRIEAGSLTAGYDGIVVRGDLRTQIGQRIAAGTSLMEIAPQSGMTIRLQIPEEKASYVRPGQTGSFAPESSPGSRHQFEITCVTPATTIHDGRNVVIAEAVVDGDREWMQSGMSGHAIVRSEWKPVWWLMGHGIINGLRKGFWL
ncbi:MAG: HlyD family efflux transporter periplasmic adaptor subunit [Planctomycetota bacterium]